ncbi:uncharacterized protein LOC126810087 [Patella vulgata]|uniref:uncharacterized protein LOC126810087 n=1 Tax=Patella vulgata TaxID=6465 RepID=UPI0021801710|nr:uncharacterized protein LOC126810087 [Patella vulgata]
MTKVVHKQELKSAMSKKSENKTKKAIPAKKLKMSFFTKFLVLIFGMIIFSKLISPVRASDRPPVRAADRPPVRASDRPPLLGSDTCDYDWSNNPKNNKVTPGDNQTFRISFKCQSSVINIQVVFYTDRSSTPINVWKLYDERGNQAYNPQFKEGIQIEVDLKNGKMNMTVNNITLQGRIVVRIDVPNVPNGRIYIPPQQVPETSTDNSVIPSVEGSTVVIWFLFDVNNVTSFNIKFLKKIIDPSTKHRITNETAGSHTKISLVINQVSLEDAGIYKCYVNNFQQSIDRKLSVSEFSWIIEKKDVPGCVGEDLNLEWKFKTPQVPDEVLAFKDKTRGLVKWSNGRIEHAGWPRFDFNLTSNGTIWRILLTIRNLTSEDLTDYMTTLDFGRDAYILSPGLHVTGKTSCSDESIVDSTTRPTTNNEIKTTTMENREVQHKSTSTWIIVTVPVLLLLIIIIIIIIRKRILAFVSRRKIRYKRKNNSDDVNSKMLTCRSG